VRQWHTSLHVSIGRERHKATRLTHSCPCARSTDAFEDWYEAAQQLQRVVHTYLELAGTALTGTASAFKRVRPLIALPMPGVGLMDANKLLHDDTLFKWILPELYEAVNVYGVDVALCTTDQRAFDVMQVRAPASSRELQLSTI
jgi:hypothetical protein